jgi:hypothetical protein
MKTSIQLLHDLYPTELFTTNFDSVMNSEVEKFNIEYYNNFLVKFTELTQNSVLKESDFKSYLNSEADFFYKEIYQEKASKTTEAEKEKLLNFKKVFFKEGLEFDLARKQINDSYAYILKHYKNFSTNLGLVLLNHNYIVFFLNKNPEENYQTLKKFESNIKKTLNNFQKPTEILVDIHQLRIQNDNRAPIIERIKKMNQKLNSFYEIIKWKIFFLEIVHVVEKSHQSIDHLKLKFEIGEFLHQEVFSNNTGFSIFKEMVEQSEIKKGTNFYSFLFNQLKKDGMITKGITNGNYIDWLYSNYEYKLSRVIELKDMKIEKYMPLYEKAKHIYLGTANL